MFVDTIRLLPMKTKSIILTILFVCASCLTGEIEVNDFFSVTGFVDTSYTYLDKESDATTVAGINKTDEAFSLEEIELMFLVDFQPLSARIDIEYEDGDNELDLEQAYIDYDVEHRFLKSSVITLGRYASMLGFEAYEPTDLYLYSNAYGGLLGELIGASLSSIAPDPRIARDTDVSVFYDSLLFPVSERYSQGIRYTLKNETHFFGMSVQDSTVSYDNRLRGDDDLDDGAVYDYGYGLELAYSYDFMRIVNFFLGGAYEVGKGIDTFGVSVGDVHTYVLNSHVTCQLGAWLLAAEVNVSETKMDDFLESGADARIESITGLFMANYVYNEKASVTGRISYIDLDADGGTGDSDSDGYAFKYTLAHNYAFLDALLLATEFSYSAGRLNRGGRNADTEELFGGAELIFMF